jgi:DNA replication protein DnaC
LPVAQWHDIIAEPTVADSILDRLLSNAHRLELKGPSLRRQKEKKIM